MAVFSSSINLIFAMSSIWQCLQDSSAGTIASCTNIDTKGVKTNYNCTYDATTKKWSCVKAKTSSGTPNQIPGSETVSKMTDSQIPLGLKNELDSVIKNKNISLVKGTEEEQKQASNMTEVDGNHSSISKKYNKSSTLTQLNDLQVARGLH
jgi:hypothetical protein